jgi:hypothetical protein
MSLLTAKPDTKGRIKMAPISGHFRKVQERKDEKNALVQAASLARIQAYCDSRTIAAQSLSN